MSYLALETEAGASASNPRRPPLHSATKGIAMTELTLFFAPDTCARVSMIALEETGHPYTELIALKRGDHRSPRYLAINPKGRVPALFVNGRVLTENVAILLWLATRFPGRAFCRGMRTPSKRRRWLPIWLTARRDCIRS